MSTMFLVGVTGPKICLGRRPPFPPKSSPRSYRLSSWPGLDEACALPLRTEMARGGPREWARAIWRARYRVVLALWAVALVVIGGNVVLDQGKEVGASSGLSSNSVRDSEGSTLYYQVGRKRCLRGSSGGVADECTCVEGYGGEDCRDAICPGGCSHGRCLRPGYCTCEEGWRGRQCDEPTCKQRCVHGRCHYPNFCKCNQGWHGWKCDRQCVHGVFSQRKQSCVCDAGWTGPDCKLALCEREGCYHGNCVEPDRCACFVGWSGSNCTTDLVGDMADELTAGLVFRSQRWPSLTVHNSTRKLDEAWKSIKKWTGGLEDGWKLGRTRFLNALPQDDELGGKLLDKYATCVAVGNSGSLLGVKAGAVIDAHQLVLRYNDGVTRGYEETHGRRTTHRLLNRKHADSLVARQQARASAPPPPIGKKVRPRRPSREMTLLWRAESYQHYAVLRRLLPEDKIFMVSPQFLIPIFRFFKQVMQRMEERGLRWESGQATPHGFVGVLLLMQVCDRVTVYGFDEPAAFTRGRRYHYYDKIEPAEPHANDVEFTILRILDGLGLIRLCLPGNLEACVGEDEVLFGLAGN